MKHWSANLFPWIPEGKMSSVAAPRAGAYVCADERFQGRRHREESGSSPGACAPAVGAEPGARGTARVGSSGPRGIICGSAAAVWMLASLHGEQPANTTLPPSLPPLLRYLHFPSSNHFFLWILKLTHFEILWSEKWQVILEIALVCCLGEAC